MIVTGHDDPNDSVEEYSDDGDATDEEMDEKAWLRDAWAEQTKQEAKVQEAATRLRSKIRSNPKVHLGDIRGNWTLYSSQYLKMYANDPEAEINDEDLLK